MAKIPTLKIRPDVHKLRVLIVDDQPVVRERVAELVTREPDLAVCGGADSAAAAFKIIEACKPHLVVTDLCLKGGHGLEFIKDVRVRLPAVRILVFSMYDEGLYAERAIRGGASGFVSKHQPTEELVDAIRRVMKGEIYLSHSAAARSLRQFFGHPVRMTTARGIVKLSDREIEVFELIGRGLSSREIARQLNLDVKTVETYRARIKTKLSIVSASQLTRHAYASLAKNILPPSL